MTTTFADRLALARRVIADVGAHPDEWRRHAPVWWRDQLQAATDETMANLTKAAPVLSELEPGRWDGASPTIDEATPRQSALLLAALLGCTPCGHLRPPNRPHPDVVLADLNHRLVLCRRCAGTRRRAVDDDRCEVCDGRVPDRQFESFVIACAGVTYVGNAGDCCASALLDRTEEKQ